MDMDSGKQGSSQTSSEESERLEQAKDESVGTAKRSYECTFCKRGFTNAQALGGHMNIHRKDRAKAKQQLITTTSSHSSKSRDEFLSASRSCVGSNSSEPARYYPIIEAQRAYHACFHPPGPSPRQQQYGYYGSDPFRRARAAAAASLCINEELLGADLSLGIGPAEMESNELVKRYMRKEDEIDLELRLGHHP